MSRSCPPLLRPRSGLPLLRPLFFAGAASLLLSLPACSGLKQTLGMEPVAPDEFQVIARAPLSLPPDYSLRPPRPGAHRPQDVAPTDQARQTVFNAVEKPVPPPAPADRSAGEAALLKGAGAGTADSSIRQLVTKESSRYKEEERGFVNSLLFWQGSTAAPDETIDPAQEAQRLQQKAADSASSPADKPSIIRRSTTSGSGSDSGGSFLGGLFKGVF